MKVFKETINVLLSLDGRSTYFDITDRVKEIVEKSGINSGIAVISSSHTTCSVFFEEVEQDHMPNGLTFLQQDLEKALEKMIPYQDHWGQYFYPGTEHFEIVEAWPDIKSFLPSGTREELCR